MNAIEKIKAKLSAYPDVPYSERANYIDVYPKDSSVKKSRSSVQH
jgi:hypothetical protein